MNKISLLILLVSFTPYTSGAQTSEHIKILRESKPEYHRIDLQENLNRQCVALCGDGYFYDRPGAKHNGRELVCTKYPLDCGYGCTVGWNFRYLINDTDFTCQEAVQRR